MISLLNFGWDGGVHPTGITERDACLKIGLPVLLRNLEDYTTDRRGDVGSQCATDTAFHAVAAC